MAEYHIRVVPNKTDEKTKLRTDGVYVQFGTRPWWSYNIVAYEKWYNIIRIFDDKHVVVFGSSEYPFCFVDNDDSTPDRKELGIEDPTDVLQTVQAFSKLPFSTFFNTDEPCEFRGIPGYFKHHDKYRMETWHLITPIDSEEDQELIDSEENSEDLGWVQSTYYNDDFTFFHNGDVNILYDYGSPCRIEYDKNDEKTNHNFPMYFIPFDLSEKNRWELILSEWNKFKPSPSNSAE